jgi:hypothetical protein
MIFRAVIVDKSILAVNMYRLLLRPLVTTFLVAKRYEEARPWFFRRDRIDLAIFNSNTFGKKFDEYFEHFSKDEPLAKVPKIFLCREKEDGWQKKLKSLQKSAVVMRPFHPDDFLALLKRVAEKSK